MASRIVLSDDLTKVEGDDVQTVTIRLDDDVVECDLSDENYAALQIALAPYFEAGRTSTVPGRRSGGYDYHAATVRQWAAANGYDVNPRGRIAKIVVDAYKVEVERRRAEREAALAAAVDEVEDETSDEDDEAAEVDENQTELHLVQ